MDSFKVIKTNVSHWLNEMCIRAFCMIALFLMLGVAVCWAGKKKTVTLNAIKGYPSGIIDEYCFRGGNAVIRGTVCNADFKTIKLYAVDRFSAREVVHVIDIADDGSFNATVSLPHSLYVNLDPFDDNVFLAVGDTLDIKADGDKVMYSGTGVTEEVNRLWPKLKKQFYDDFALSTPWQKADKSLMMKWNSEVVRQLDATVNAINADTISLLKECSAQSADFLKTNLIATPLRQLGYGFHMYRVALFNSDHRSDPNSVLSYTDYFGFLKDRESYLLNNPLMIFSESDVISAMEYAVFVMIAMRANDLSIGCLSSENVDIQGYKANFILPELYSKDIHEQILSVRNGKVFSVADYYKTTSDSISSKFCISPNSFIEQMCLLHHMMLEDDEEAVDNNFNLATERFAAAIPLLSNRLVAYRAVKEYQKLINSQKSRISAPIPMTKGDLLFKDIVDRYKGNVLFIDFWGLSCGPCRQEMLNQRKDVEYFKDKKVKYLYICNEKDSPRAPTEDFLKESNIGGEHIFLSPDDWNHIAQKFQFQAVPFCLLLDTEGCIVEKNTRVSKEKIESLLKQ